MPECRMCYQPMRLVGSGRPRVVCDSCAKVIAERMSNRKPWDSDCAFCGRTLILVRSHCAAITCSSACRTNLSRVLKRYPEFKNKPPRPPRNLRLF
ncbi:MAG: hypothetical protein OXI22_08055 [Defluviicoccus sp.]|nr:hypothetical protein [Defluviicoccus sp.]